MNNKSKNFYSNIEVFSDSGGGSGYKSLSGRKSTSLSSNLNQWSGGSRSGSGGKWSAMQDWMKIVRSPTRYRVGGNRFNLVIRPNLKIALMTTAIILCFCLFYYLLSSGTNHNSDIDAIDTNDRLDSSDSKLPLGKNAVKLIYEAYNDGVILFRFFFCYYRSIKFSGIHIRK